MVPCCEHLATNGPAAVGTLSVAPPKGLGSMSSEGGPKVLIVGQGPPTLGGISTFITNLIGNDWLAHQADLELLNTTPSGIKRPGKLRVSNLRLTATHASLVFRRARATSVVHLNVAPTPLLPLFRALTLCAAARAAGAKVLLHAHSGRLPECVQSPLYRLALRLSCALIDTFIVVSREAYEAIDRLGCNVLHLDNGIDVERFLTGPKDRDPPLMTFLGTICERKGLLDLRDALVSLRGDQRSLPMRVELVGDDRQEGPGAMERMTAAYADQLHEVEFLGAVSSDQVVKVLARTSIFCLPSHWEGSPLSLLEAMAAGSAIVATGVGDIPAILDEGRCGMIVEPHDSHALAGAIKRLIDDPDLRQQLGAAARARVRDEYGLQQTTRALAELYREPSGYSE